MRLDSSRGSAHAGAMDESSHPDPIELKASLLVEGVQATTEALAGVGTEYKE